MLVITGQPGNRKDFVVGWISSNNRKQFVPPRRWHIDPVWGKNIIDTTWDWGGDTDPARMRQDADGIKTAIREICREQRVDTARWAVTKTHLTSQALLGFIPEELQEHFVILDILATDKESIITILWESFVKNILMHLDSSDPVTVAHGRRNLRLEVPQELHINDQTIMLETAYAKLCRQIKTKEFLISTMFNSSATSDRVKTIPIEYRDLMTPAGPQLLSDRLGMELSRESWHLPMAMTHSRDRYYVNGQWWIRPMG